MGCQEASPLPWGGTSFGGCKEDAEEPDDLPTALEAPGASKLTPCPSSDLPPQRLSSIIENDVYTAVVNGCAVPFNGLVNRLRGINPKRKRGPVKVPTLSLWRVGLVWQA
jgi:hypothetical protein